MFGRKDKNILVIKADGLAAFVECEPVFAAIRQANKNAKISLLTSAPLQRLAKASPYFDQVAAMPNFRDAAARKEFTKQLKAAKFERIFDLAADETSKKLQGALGPFKPKWFGVNSSQRRGELAPTLDFSKMAQNAGLDIDARLPDFSWAMEARKDSANMKPSWYGISGQFGLLLPGSADERRWTAEGYAGLAKIMSQSGFMPVLAGPKELHSFADEVAHEAPQLVDLTGKADLLQLAALAHEAGFFVTDAAEEVHLAVSVGCMGVLITNSKSPIPPPEGRHVVTLLSEQGAAGVDAGFVWRTLTNMGLICSDAGDNAQAGAR